MNADVEAWIASGVVGVFVAAVVYSIGRAWWEGRRRSRRLAAVYERLSSEPPTVTTRAVTAPAITPPMRLRPVREPFPKARDTAQPRREELRREVDRSITERRPTRMNIPVCRPVVTPRPVAPARLAGSRRWQSEPARARDDADDDIWLRRSLDVQVSHASPAGFEPSLTLPSTPEPPYAGGGGEFGGGGASGSWEAPTPDPSPSVDASPSFDPSVDTDSFGSDP